MPKRLSKQRAIDLLNKADKLKKRELKRTVIVPGPGAGDRLASGAHSATFRMPAVAQQEWDRAFMSDEEFKAKYGKAHKKKVQENPQAD